MNYKHKLVKKGLVMGYDMVTEEVLDNGVEVVRWEDGTIKMYVYRNKDGSVYGKEIYDRDGKIDKKIWNDGLDHCRFEDFWDNGEQKIEWYIKIGGDEEVERSVYNRHGHRYSFDGKPCEFERNGWKVVRMGWHNKFRKNKEKDPFLNEIPPVFVRFKSDDTIDVLLDENNSPSSFFKAVLLSDNPNYEDNNTVKYIDDSGELVTVGLDEMSDDVKAKFDEYIRKITECKNHYMEEFRDTSNEVFKL